jgi:hypothetical protein
VSVVWALHLRQATGQTVLMVIEIPADADLPPVVHSATTATGSADRHLSVLGWQADGIWQSRSYGGVVRLQPWHPSS